jgi:4-alpha-glucanotransferase
VALAARRLIREALDALGIRRLLLGIHDAAFPMLPSEDVGRGSPHSAAAADLLDFAASLGFDGIQLGPQGATSRSNPSPYDGALFSREPLSIALAPLATQEWGSLLGPETLAAAVAARPGPADRVAHAHAFDAVSRALAEAADTFRARAARGEGGEIAELSRRLASFRARHAGWLERDALHDALQRSHGGASWRGWPAADRDLFLGRSGGERRRALAARHARELEDHAFVQLLAHEQHARLRERARALGLALFGDLQIGLSERDAWYAQGLVLRDWRMGAPPSRTDPGGQPWGFAVLDPRLYFEPGGGPGPVLRFARERARKVAEEYDGIRVDHPHGLVTPWVYRPEGDPRAAVRDGARLFDSPAVPEHPALAAFAIARADQIDPAVPRHADGWVAALDAAQVERYAALFDVLMESARDRRDVACEILSTQPYPLARVIERHRLGRFRVTQKADLDDPRDVYRGENAAPEDWIMAGSHDTRPIWAVAESWALDGTARRRADHLAARLLGDGEDRQAWARAVAADPRALARASLAELFAGPARNVVISFTDLFGSREPYNVPGTVSPENWSQRLPPDFRRLHAERLAAGAALDVPRAIARALRSRRGAAARRELVAALEAGERSPA